MCERESVCVCRSHLELVILFVNGSTALQQDTPLLHLCCQVQWSSPEAEGRTYKKTQR